MALGYRLVPLSCPACGAPIAAEADDVVFYCTACKNAHLLDRSTGALAPIAVTFLAAPAMAVTRRLPFWLLPARVELLERSTEGGGGLLHLFDGGAPSSAGNADVSFAVPAFAAPLTVAVELAKRYSAQFPAAGELVGEALTGGSLRVEDARTWAEFALISAEMAKPDKLTQLRYRLTFGDARLLGVPFVGAAGSLRDAFFGLPAA
jgi:hypothetical protein